MQALILAAGMGKRLQKYTAGNTKCMVKVGGKTLLERMCDSLKSANINKLVLVLGYQSQNVIDFMKENITDMEWEYIINENYEETNNIYSLFLAKELLAREDTILMESDLIFDPGIIQNVVNDKHKNLAVVAKYEYWMDGTVCKLDKDGNIREFVWKDDFQYREAEKYYKTVNIYKFSKEFSQEKYIPFLEAYILVYGKNQYYESVLKIIAHINKMDLWALEIGNIKWYEIDNAQDLDIAETMFKQKERRLSTYEKHYGGYWRFPKIYDYCYLVNPFFPNDRFNQQMEYMFGTLLSKYPSGMQVQRINAARIFNLEEEFTIVGNGAAELINILGKVISGKVGIPSPVFNEYVRCFNQDNIVNIVNDISDYNYENIMRVMDTVQTIVLVTPDNPSGRLLPYETVMSIIKTAKRKNVRVIIDESFIDFADPDVRYTLLNNKTIKKYNNLVVIKSISKSFGVAGIRLGVLATSDVELLKKIERNMAVWNINSFAEYFLEILPAYQTEYSEACRKLAKERKRFQDELSKIKYLNVYPSQANFIMCGVSKIKSRVLANKLLDQYNILIKDLSTKTGINGKQCIRLAIMTKEENDFLISALREIGEEIS